MPIRNVINDKNREKREAQLLAKERELHHLQVLKEAAIEAKKEKNFELADQIRADLDEKGIILNDTVNGTTWDIKELY